MTTSFVLKSIKGLVFFITGGGSGLGAGCVHRFLSLGCRVVAFDLAFPDDLPDNENFLFVKGNVTSEKDVRAGLEETMQKFGALHVLVNCAGVLLVQKTFDPETQQPHSLEDFQRVVNINLVGTFNVIRLATTYMANNKADNLLNANRCTDNDAGILARGVIINAASISGYEGQTEMMAYSTTKAAVIGMTLPMARDLTHIGVRVVSIAPGTCHTPMAVGGLSEETIANLARTSIPFPKRLIHPDEFAHLVESIVVNPMINGETIRIDAAVRFAMETTVLRGSFDL